VKTEQPADTAPVPGTPRAVHERMVVPVRTLRDTFRRFGPLARPDRGTMLTAAALLIVAAAADTVAVLMFMDVIDGVVSTDRSSAFWVPGGIWLAAAVTGAVASGAGSYLSARAAERFLLRLRDAAFGHLQRLAPDFFERHPTGDLVARMSGDVENIEALVSSGVVQAVAAVVAVVFFTAAAFWISWTLTLVVLALVPLLALGTRRLAARLQTTVQAERASNGAISSVVEQGLAQVGLV
jgi:ATP-binding cassette, subfamily B, bacterial